LLNVRKNVIFSVIEILTTLALTFINYRILVQYAGISALGVWAAIFAWLSIVRLTDLGMGSALTRYVSALDAKQDIGRIVQLLHTGIISNGLVFLLLALALGGVLGATLPTLVGGEHVEMAADALPWMVAGLLVNSWSGVVMSALMALHVGYRRSMLAIVGGLIQMGLAVVLIPERGITGLAIAQFVQFSLLTVAGWLTVCVTLGRFELPTQFRWSVFKEMLGFSAKLQFAGAINGLFEPLSKILISKFGGMAMLGLYEAAFRSMFLARNVAVQASTATVPAMTRHVWHEQDLARALYVKTYWNVLRFLGLTITGVVIVSPLTSYFWFGDINWMFISMTAILALGVAASGWCTPAYNIGLATGQLRGNIVATGSSVLLLAVAGMAFGLLGMPLMIVGVATVCMFLSSSLIVRFNERSIGLSRLRFRIIQPTTSA
jgi:O-antigen/teichoic acid export membrane protein